MRRASRAELARALRDARDAAWRVLGAFGPDPRQLPHRLDDDPPLWTIGHVAWFQERWCVRRDDDGRVARGSTLERADDWFDDARASPGDRWRLALPPLRTLRQWTDAVLGATLERLAATPDDDAGLHGFRYALLHEWSHVEALGTSAHALGCPQPGEGWDPPSPLVLRADVRVAGGSTLLGSAPDDGFSFGNEHWAHPVRIDPFEISLEPVTNAEFLQFVEDGGYLRPRLWTPDAYARIAAGGRTAPATWRRIGERWTQRWFDRWLPLEPFAPVVQVDAHEAEAWCAWAGRRLPTEAEWEHAAATRDDFEWGDSVWEWTASAPEPYPGFEKEPALDGPRPPGVPMRIVRGGSFATSRALVDRCLRRALPAARADAFVGFRSCAPR